MYWPTMPQYKLPPLKFYSIGRKNNLIHLFADKQSPRRQNLVQIFNFRRHRSIPQRASVLTSKTGQANVKNLAPKASKTSPAWNEDSWFLASARMKGQHLIQGILKGEVSLYHWPPVWLVWNQLYDNWQFLFLLAKQTNPNQSNRGSMVQWHFPL